MTAETALTIGTFVYAIFGILVTIYGLYLNYKQARVFEVQQKALDRLEKIEQHLSALRERAR